MSERRTYVHLGVIIDPTHLGAVLPETQFQHGGYTFHARHNGLGHLDSFTAWCEPAVDTEPVHLLVTVPDEDVRNVGYGDQQRMVTSAMASIEAWLTTTIPSSHVSWRVCDYAVLTDSDDWTERVEFVGRFA